MSTMLEQALERFDAINAEDPTTEDIGGEVVPRALIYGRRMSARLAAFAPSAPDVVKLAVRAQHLRRWALPRGDFPMGRAGYLTWRVRCAQMHAELAAEVLEAVGYDDETIGAVRRALTKRGLKTDRNVQLVEDVACLVFLEHYAPEFVGKHPKGKIIAILRKTWEKMSEAGHAAALELPLDAVVREVVEEALA